MGVEREGETGVECKAEKAALPKETEVAAMHTINSQQSGQQTNPLLSLSPLSSPISLFPLAKPGLFDQFEPIRGLQTGRRRNAHFAALAALV